VRTLALAAALALSLAPLVGESLGWIALVGAPRVGLALAPWVVLAGVPRAGLRHGVHELALLLALPAVSLAAAVDRAGGATAAFATAAAGLGLVALGALGAARGARAYAALWFAGVCAPAGLATAFALSAAGGDGEPAALGAWLCATPWAWTGRAIAGAPQSPVVPLALAGLLAAVGLAEGARARPRAEAQTDAAEARADAE
jgi:hypothetical protein